MKIRKCLWIVTKQSHINNWLNTDLFIVTDYNLIPAADLSRLVFQADGGIVMNYKTIYLSYTQSFLTEEFMTGKTHRWGGISFGIRL